MKKYILDNWVMVLLLILSGFVVWPLFVRGYFSHHDDLQVMRIFEMRKCFTDFQIPCRWVPDMGYGNGYPLFNFYGVFAYYLGGILSYVLGYLGAAKALFFIPLVAGGVGMYLLAKEIFGKISGFIAGVLYLFAPYRALDAYVRGAVAELFAMTAVPFLLYFLLKFVKEGKKKYFILTTIFTAVFFLSHNIMALIFSPMILLMSIYFLFENKWKNWKGVLVSFFLGAILSAFFVIPAFFEKNLVQTEALTRAELDFRAQFVKIGQLFFDKSWRYSGSSPQSDNTISYQIGWPLWWIVAASVIPLVLVKKSKKTLPIILFGVFGISTLMMHNKSAPIWETFKILSYVQFPWRFLSVVIFSGSLLAAFAMSIITHKKYVWILSLTVVAASILFNWRYFRPEHFYSDMTDSRKLSGQNFIDQQKGALLDYLPKTALEPRELAPAEPIVLNSDARIENYMIKSNEWSFNVASDRKSVINIPVFDFPSWVTFVDGNEFSHGRAFPTGRIEMSIPEGEHLVRGKFKNTPIRTFSNLISLAALITFAAFIKYGKNTRLFS